MVPMPMISAPLSARTLRIENIRSCLRIVDAPSTPSSSAMVTSSAGDFCLRSLRCIGESFLWKLGIGALDQADAAGSLISGGTGTGELEGQADEAASSRSYGRSG